MDPKIVTAHYEAKNRHLHNPKPRYNADEPQKGGPTSAYSKGISHQPVVRNQYLWITKNGGPLRYISSTTWQKCGHTSSKISVHCFTTSNSFELLLFLDIWCNRYVAIFSYGVVIQKDSVEEYELLAKQGGGAYPSFISWFKQTVISIRQFHFIR